MITKSQKISRDSQKKGGPGVLKTQKGIWRQLFYMTDRRRRFKAESQRKDCPKGHDYDHNTKRCVTSSHNRGGTQSKSKKDGTKAERRQNKR